MIDNMTWNGFCELYYSEAKEIARIHLSKTKKKIGAFGKYVDEDYIVDSATFSGLEKCYASFDSARKVKVTTFLSTIIHNEVVTLVEQEQNGSNRKSDVEDLRLEIKSIESVLSDEAREELVSKLMAAIAKLPQWDQVILENYLDDKSSYVSVSADQLGVSENTVRLRRFRIFEALPSLMNMSRAQYLQYFTEKESTVLAGKCIKYNMEERLSVPINFIDSGLDLRQMAEKIVAGHIEIIQTRF